jgi:hypothetical protein
VARRVVSLFFFKGKLGFLDHDAKMDDIRSMSL